MYCPTHVWVVLLLQLLHPKHVAGGRMVAYWIGSGSVVPVCHLLLPAGGGGTGSQVLWGNKAGNRWPSSGVWGSCPYVSTGGFPYFCSNACALPPSELEPNFCYKTWRPSSWDLDHCSEAATLAHGICLTDDSVVSLVCVSNSFQGTGGPLKPACLSFSGCYNNNV